LPFSASASCDHTSAKLAEIEHNLDAVEKSFFGITTDEIKENPKQMVSLLTSISEGVGLFKISANECFEEGKPEIGASITGLYVRSKRITERLAQALVYAL
jgi:hypothetical protein